ncbi:PTS sugar transporter subunit IIA [Anaerococcus sp. AGMB09787]|uniref:PTS sugar transporter subunit IIA n=1 Tax=Anaerococcus sp. AGMB09787 TaxID=2922869 RepID=UPI001FAF71ED|nr:PTS sugar transporter subunit IIA [Anaerococcus sp. AGMB09787]
MANGVIVVSHASLASGVYSAIKMIAGDFENVRVLEFKENDNLEELDQKIKDAYEELSSYENVLVLADLAGGTPFNRSVMSIGDKANVRVIGGLNFAALFTAINSVSSDVDEAVREVIDEAKGSIMAYEVEAPSDADVEDNDGI